ncbi:MAG TPA: sulfite dehydrogenase [Vicinamibacterales bacterium]|jgi:sulfane dehydrogenase subunit SoxC|nr:sulfite dehydrogenase [Vicinamibacterales bacterium]
MRKTHPSVPATPRQGLTRRALLATTVGAAALTLNPEVARGQAAPPEDTTKKWGRLPNGLGARSPAESPKRTLNLPTSSRTPLQDLHGTITPSDLHYERHHAGLPVVDPRTYRLLVHGMVDRPLTFTLDEVKRFPAVTRTCFLECAGNFFGTREETTPQDVCGLTSQSEWTGVLLSNIFNEVGAQRAATWFLAEGQDAAVMTRSVPIKEVLGEAMLAYAQNGEALRPEQGYPVRLLLPGIEGNASVKWLRRMKLSDQPFMTREETSKYTDPLADGTAREFSLVMDARSVITSPAYPQTVAKGFVEIRGIAWSGRGVVRRVEISTDGGRTWKPAVLQQPVLPKAHTRFRYAWEWDGRPTEIVSRAVDETGYAQPDMSALRAARGRRTRYHLNPVTGWTVAADGRVRFAVERVRV